MATRKAITRALALKYRDGSKELKGEILDTVCGLTGFHRDYARRALRAALKPRPVRAHAPRRPKYEPVIVAALTKCWAVLNAPAGKRLSPMLASWFRCCAATASWTWTTRPPPCRWGCRRQRSTGGWPWPGPGCCPGAARTASQRRC